MNFHAFEDEGNALLRLPLWPWFDLASYTLTSLMVKDDYLKFSKEGPSFARHHPLATLIASVLLSTGGGFLGNILLGNSALSPYVNVRDVLSITLIWYLLNFCPGDLYYKVASSKMGKYFLCMLKEVHRTQKVLGGVQLAAKLHPGALSIMFIMGTVKGAGANLLRSPVRFILGFWTPEENELLRPTLFTKLSALGALLFTLQHHGLLQISLPLLAITLLAFYEAVRFGTLILGLGDPCRAIESAICFLLFGGLWSKVEAGSHKSATVRHSEADNANDFEDNNNVLSPKKTVASKPIKSAQRRRKKQAE